MTPFALRSESIHIRGFRDLEVFGITALTGEACAYSQRLLCDVDEDGLALLREFFGFPQLELAAPMNSRVRDMPAVGSLMLTPGIWKDLAKFGFCHSQALGWVDAHGELVGLYSQELLDSYARNDFPVQRNYALTSAQPSVGSRNVHQMTGRVI